MTRDINGMRNDAVSKGKADRPSQYDRSKLSRK
jgi:hypothetical protein